MNVNGIIQFKNGKYSCHRMILKTLKVVIPHFRKQGDQDVVDSCWKWNDIKRDNEK